MSRPSKSPIERYNQLIQPPVESWMTSYGDLMTILLVFFVLLISATHVSAVKFERIKRAFQGETNEEGIALVLEQLEKQVYAADLDNAIEISTEGHTIQISFHDRLLFDLGKAKVKPDGREVIEQFAAHLSQLPEYAHIAVEGYTDDNPVNSAVYNSNWHLSALRSLAVLEILEESHVCRENCEVRGFGEFRPKAPNRDADGQPIAKNQSENRRVVLRIY